MPGARFDAAGNIDAPGAKGEDGLADVAGMETAGEDDAQFSGFGGENIFGARPVEGSAGSAGCGCGSRIQQNRIDVAMPGDGAQLVAEPFLGAGRIAVQVPVEGLDNKETGVELVAQFFRERKIEFPVKLNPVQSRRPESERNVIEILSVEDADFCEIGRQIGHDAPRCDPR